MNKPKWMIATGVGCALVAGSAAAQNSVTIYGLLDLGIATQSSEGAKLSPGYNNWLGLRGSEDLGGGLSTVFDLETRFTPNNGQFETGVYWQGESTVGLKQQGWGTIRIGRAETPLWQQRWVYEPWWASGVNGSLGAFQNGSFSSDPTFALSFANFARVPNAVFVDTDSFGGLSAHFSGQVSRNAGAAARDMSYAVTYKASALSAMVAYEKNPAKDHITLAAASYKIGGATLMGSASLVKLDDADFSEKNFELAANYTFGASTIRGGFGRTVNEEQNKSRITIGYVHSLSKRTSLYADLYHDKTATSSYGTALGIEHSF